MGRSSNIGGSSNVLMALFISSFLLRIQFHITDSVEYRELTHVWRYFFSS
jgi:hypothetical protein